MVYNIDLRDPDDYYAIVRAKKEHGGGQLYLASGPKPYRVEWHENREYDNKLIYRVAEGKSIPAVVQRTLDYMNFVEWDPAEHGEDEWNLLWKSQRPTMGEYTST